MYVVNNKRAGDIKFMKGNWNDKNKVDDDLGIIGFRRDWPAITRWWRTIKSIVPGRVSVKCNAICWLQIALFKKRKKAIILRNGYNRQWLCFLCPFVFTFNLKPTFCCSYFLPAETLFQFVSRIDFNNLNANGFSSVSFLSSFFFR